MRPRVVRVSGTWTVRASARASSSANGTSSTPCRAAVSGATNGSCATTVISSPRARSARAMPILPRPRMPRVRPRSSMPVKRARVHSPRRIEASAAAIRRATAKSRASVCSAAAMVLPVGALTTTTPAAVAASRSTLSTPTPARPTTTSRLPASNAARRPGPGCGRRARRSRAGRPGRPPDPGRSQVDLVGGPQELEAGLSERLGDEDPHAGTATRPARLASAARSAATRAAPRSTWRPRSTRTASIISSATRISSTVTAPRWPMRKILPVRAPWPPARMRPRARSAPLNSAHGRSSGRWAAVIVSEAWRGSAKRSNPSACRPARAAAPQAAWRAKMAG